MRVLYCTDTYPPQVNGVSIVTALSVGGLTRLGWECAVVAPRYPRSSHAVWNENGQSVGQPAELVSIPSFPLPGYSEIRLAVPTPGPVHRLVQRFRPDLIHCATEFSIGRLGQIAAARAGTIGRNSPPVKRRMWGK